MNTDCLECGCTKSGHTGAGCMGLGGQCPCPGYVPRPDLIPLPKVAMNIHDRAMKLVRSQRVFSERGGKATQGDVEAWDYLRSLLAARELQAFEGRGSKLEAKVAELEAQIASLESRYHG